jgi:hypothetical protein
LDNDSKGVCKDIPVACYVCGCGDMITAEKYLHRYSGNIVRDLAYRLPKNLATIAGLLSGSFSRRYRPVSINKKYFDDKVVVYCSKCGSGLCWPMFQKEVLDGYYSEFYWDNRDKVDGKHLSQEAVPNAQQLSLSRDRLTWVKQYVREVESAIDFGAGDCAAGFTMMQDGWASEVHVVDPSQRAQSMAHTYGLSYSCDMSMAPTVDFIYSAHSIEHVHDLHAMLSVWLERVVLGGHVFVETPNVGDVTVCRALMMTPHTFMLSRHSFSALESRYSFRIVAMECVGPLWAKHRPEILSDERTDLRVLLQKVK